MKCPHCRGRGRLPGFNDSPGDSQFIFCSHCAATGEVEARPTAAERRQLQQNFDTQYTTITFPGGWETVLPPGSIKLNEE